MSAVCEMRRSRPWLGTFVDIRIEGLTAVAAVAAIESAFAEIAAVHRLMSFHEPDSDLSRLHCGAHRRAVAVDARTHDVLAHALRFASESEGRFDPTIAARLVEWELLPRPRDTPPPDPRADWRDVELQTGARVRFRRPLWLDLGGIAKGYAVDRALAVLRDSGASTACVNAGGDLRRFGASPERIVLRLATTCGQPMPAVELGDAAIASSVVDARPDGRRWRSAHVDARSGRSMRPRRSTSVVADSCLVADALTKVVLADARIGARLLRRHGASACVIDDGHGWRLLGDA
jgi:thiamine biosynthesis lipoprotein